MLQFSITLHQVSQGYNHSIYKKDHLDLFLEDNSHLFLHHYFIDFQKIGLHYDKHTQRISLDSLYGHSIIWYKGNKHRMKYLSYTGKLTKKRGFVYLLHTGYYILDENIVVGLDNYSSIYFRSSRGKLDIIEDYIIVSGDC